jgi:hypothetical protein
MSPIPLAYAFGGAILGIATFALALWFVPKFLNHLTPQIDEEREILKGNQAVAIYYGLLVGSAIIGVALVIAAAVIAGIHE